MKPTIIFFLILTTYIFSVYSIPPLSQIIYNNTQIAQNLNSSYNPEFSGNSTLNFNGDIVNVSASADIAGPPILIDNISYSYPGLWMAIATGYSISPDPCIVSNSSLFNLTSTFQFENLSIEVPVSSSMVPVPQVMIDALDNSSGSEFLNVTINGAATINAACSNSSSQSTSIPLSLSKSFLFAGTNKIILLRTPILREQYSPDSDLDFIVLSQAPLLQSELILDNNITFNQSIREFNLISDRYGMDDLVSTLNPESNWSEYENLSTPTQLEEQNQSFTYIYEFNNTFSSPGSHNISFLVTDEFLSEQSYNDTFTEVIPYSNIPTIDSNTPISEANVLTISIGTIGILLLLPLVNKWVK